MTDYVRVFETSEEREANKYIDKGWDLIDTSKRSSFNGEGGYSSYTQYTLGLSAKEYSNKLFDIIREYEKYGLKDELFGRVANEMDDRIDDYRPTSGLGVVTPLAGYMSNYEEIVNDRSISFYRNNPVNDDDDLENLPF